MEVSLNGEVGLSVRQIADYKEPRLEPEPAQTQHQLTEELIVSVLHKKITIVLRAVRGVRCILFS